MKKKVKREEYSDSPVPGVFKRGEWSEDETQFLIDAKTAGELTGRQIAEALGRTLKSIERKWGNLSEKLREEGKAVPSSRRSASKANKPPLTKKFDDNHLILESTSPRIKTLKQLLRVAEVDLSEWKVDHHIINKWDVGAKSRDVDLRYEEGKATGHVKKGKVGVTELFQVKAWLIRRQPIAVEPLVVPIHVTIKQLKREPLEAPVGIKRALVLPDPHFGFGKSLRTGILKTPFHDRLALDTALQIAQYLYFDKIVWLGDLLDLADWSSKFTRSPNFYWTTQPAAHEAKWWMTQFRLAQPKAKMSLIEGNHERRMKTQLYEHLKEAVGLRSVDAIDLPPLMEIPRILALHDIDCEWIEDYPNGEVWINDYIVCEHGPIARGKSGATASAMIQDTDVTRIIGHIQRIESAVKTVHLKDCSYGVGVWSVGCLCRTDGVVPARKAKVNWQQAVGIVEYFDDGTPNHNVMPVQINNGRAIYAGQIFTGTDRVEEINESVKDLYKDGIGWRYV